MLGLKTWLGSVHPGGTRQSLRILLEMAMLTPETFDSYLKFRDWSSTG